MAVLVEADLDAAMAMNVDSALTFTPAAITSDA